MMSNMMMSYCRQRMMSVRVSGGSMMIYMILQALKTVILVCHLYDNFMMHVFDSRGYGLDIADKGNRYYRII